jgi:hypothetical protein
MFTDDVIQNYVICLLTQTSRYLYFNNSDTLAAAAIYKSQTEPTEMALTKSTQLYMINVSILVTRHHSH